MPQAEPTKPVQTKPSRTFLQLRFFPWLFSWRTMRRLAVALTCLATVIAAFYTEENWRGKTAWENYRHQWEAKGVKFDLQSLAPPPVPDDQNLALAPIIAASYINDLDAAGHPTPRESSHRRTNAVNRLYLPVEIPFCKLQSPIANPGWPDGVMTDSEAWQAYFRAAATQMSNWASWDATSEDLRKRWSLALSKPLNQTPATDVLQALSCYDDAVEELRQEAARRLECRFPFDYSGQGGVRMPYLSSLVACAHSLGLRVSAELQAGQTQKARDDFKLAARLAEGLRDEPIPLAQTTRLVIWSLAIQPVWEGAAQHLWSDRQLGDIDFELSKVDMLAAYRRATQGELAFGIRSLDSLRQTRDFATVWSWQVGWRSLESYRTAFVRFHLAPAGWFYQSQLALARTVKDDLLPIVDEGRRTISPQLAQRAEVAQQTGTADGGHYSPVPRPTRTTPELSSRVRLAQFCALGQTYIDLARVGCALERYRLAHGAYPETLDVLAPQFIDKVPHDVINGQPLNYRLTNKGLFVLYSVGWDEKDDGGLSVALENGKVNPGQGDWVWKYPDP